MYIFIKLHDRKGRLALYFSTSSCVRDKWLLILAMPVIVYVMVIQKIRDSLLYELVSNSALAFAVTPLAISLHRHLCGSKSLTEGSTLSPLTYVLSSQAGNKEAMLWLALLQFIEMFHFLNFHFCRVFLIKIMISYT